jgi:hypothetical protein
LGRVLIHVDTDKSELLVNIRFAMYPFRELNTTRTFTRMMEASWPAASVAKVRNVATEVEQQPTVPNTEPVSVRGVRPSEEEQGHSLGIELG